MSTTAVMPMRMPSIVSAERRRWVRTASVAVRSVSRQVIGVARRRGQRGDVAVRLPDLAVADLDDRVRRGRRRRARA